jgi:hypothetical protein
VIWAAGLVTGTIQWRDAAETSGRLELLLGRELQFVHINGTVAGAQKGWPGTPGGGRRMIVSSCDTPDRSHLACRILVP